MFELFVGFTNFAKFLLGEKKPAMGGLINLQDNNLQWLEHAGGAVLLHVIQAKIWPFIAT